MQGRKTNACASVAFLDAVFGKKVDCAQIRDAGGTLDEAHRCICAGYWLTTCLSRRCPGRPGCSPLSSKRGAGGTSVDRSRRSPPIKNVIWTTHGPWPEAFVFCKITWRAWQLATLWGAGFASDHTSQICRCLCPRQMFLVTLADRTIISTLLRTGCSASFWKLLGKHKNCVCATCDALRRTGKIIALLRLARGGKIRLCGNTNICTSTCIIRRSRP